MKRPDLRTRIVIGLCVYSLLLTGAVGLHGYLVNENIEKLVWQTVLNAETDYIRKRLASDPRFKDSLKNSFYWYDENRHDTIPAAFKHLTLGIHDEVAYANKNFVVMIEQVHGHKQILAMDITAIENHEQMVILWILTLTLLVVTIMAITAYWGLGRLIEPILKIARDIASLSPDGLNKKIVVSDSSPYEAFIISEALTQYMQRIQQHIQREKDFINTASHELRTPISVISGAMEVALNHPDTHGNIVPYLQRTARITHEMEELLTLLLALAKDKTKLRNSAELINISQEVGNIIEHHLYLCEGKQLSIIQYIDPKFQVHLPRQLFRVAVSNLVRNAIENSDSGKIYITSVNDKLIIEDPGHAMNAIAISELYTHLIKSGKQGLGGIGLELILRICQHFGWELEFEALSPKGTRATLSLNQSYGSLR